MSINSGVVKGQAPLKLYSGSDGMHVRTDENPEVFVLCGFCRPGANARGKTRENSKKWRPATFLTKGSIYLPSRILIAALLTAGISAAITHSTVSAPMVVRLYIKEYNQALW